jgi:3-oxoadipate enol-lactonase
MKIPVNGLSLEVRIEGQSGPCIIFSHSLATNLSMWKEQAVLLSRNFRVVRYDTRGHGSSDVPSGPYHMRDLVNDVVGLMDALLIEKAHFVGLSLGGSTAIGLAIDHPERILSIAVCDARADAPASFRAAWDERIQIARDQGMPALVEPTLQRWFTPASYIAKPAVIAKVRAMIGSTPPEGFIACAQALQSLDYATKLEAIRVSVLLLAGAEDSVFPALNREMFARIPGARIVSIPGAGHLSSLDQPDAFSAALLDFLEGSGDHPSR